MAKGKR
jgi:hypothetical protein